jgi:hypothetical protein
MGIPCGLLRVLVRFFFKKTPPTPHEKWLRVERKEATTKESKNYIISKYHAEFF